MATDIQPQPVASDLNGMQSAREPNPSLNVASPSSNHHNNNDAQYQPSPTAATTNGTPATPQSPRKRERDEEDRDGHRKRHHADGGAGVNAHANGVGHISHDHANSDDDGEGSVDGEGEVDGPGGYGVGQGTATSSAVSPAPTAQAGALPKHHQKFLQSVLKNIQKLKDATIFLNPVDPVALNIPTYFDFIKRPMDLSTIEKKLKTNQYGSIKDFSDDMDLMLQNCWTFNGAQGQIADLAYSVQRAFKKQMEKLPKVQPAKESAPKKRAPSVDLHDMHDQDAPRPKREIHAPTKDLPQQSPISGPHRKNSTKKGDHGLKQCGAILRDLTSSKKHPYNWPFLLPVGPEITGYHDLIKQPIDLSTIKRKLDEGEYDSADDFKEDMELMFRNCYTFNLPGSDVYNAGKQLQAAFHQKWKEIPAAPRTPQVDTAKAAKKAKEGRKKADYTDDEDDDEESDEDEELRLKMEALEKSIIVAKAELDLLQTKMQQRKAKKQKRKSLTTSSLLGSHHSTPMAGKAPSSAAKPKTKTPKPKATPGSEKPKQQRKPTQPKKPKKGGDDDGVPHNPPPLSQDQKQELAHLIEQLDESKHAEMITLLQSSVQPTDGQTEIVLDLEMLDKRTAYRLYQFVKKQTRGPPVPQKPTKPVKDKKPAGAGLSGARGLGGHSSSSSDSDSSSGSESDSGSASD
ncbi:hypothetical protein HDV00_012499 [Rhizophlyctis rosea]|nr:hypothetical protein HDV00_012499 [Rhizophlyctis rosea]